jgi:hypothetical protein
MISGTFFAHSLPRGGKWAMRTLIGMAAVAVPMTMAISGDFTAGVLAMAGSAVAAGWVAGWLFH